MTSEPTLRGVVVTRGEGSDGPLSSILRSRGARVLHWGSIGFAPPEDPSPFREALRELDRFDWIFFSSPRAVEAVTRDVPRPPPGIRTVVVGPSTGKALEEVGWGVDRMPVEASGRGVVEAFRVAGDAPGSRVFFPASAVAREEVPEGLRSLGAEVHQVTAYRMVTLPLDPEACRKAFLEGDVQVVTFASPSAMEGLRAGLGETLFLEMAAAVPAAAMGETTARALRAAGWSRVVVASEASLEGLAEAALKDPPES